MTKPRVLAINSSPRGGKGNTARLLNSVIEGIKSEGGTVDLFNLVDMNIEYCRGNLICWTRPDKKCVIDDDMTQILDSYSKSEILVLASPVFVYGITGMMKNALDRMVPIMPGAVKKLVLVSTCGLWGMDQFDPLIDQMKLLASKSDYVYSGSIVRPHAPGIPQMEQAGFPVSHVYDAAVEAGKQLVNAGMIKDETQNIISSELIPESDYAKSVEEAFETKSEE